MQMLPLLAFLLYATSKLAQLRIVYLGKQTYELPPEVNRGPLATEHPSTFIPKRWPHLNSNRSSSGT
jgi:hypothetical protein